MTTITLYRDTTRDATCVEPADLDAFDGAWTDYMHRVEKAAESAGIYVQIGARSAGASYTVDDGTKDVHTLMQNIENAHDLMQGIEFWT